MQVNSEVRKAIVSYLDNTLSDEDADIILDWIGEDRSRRNFIYDMKRIAASRTASESIEDLHILEKKIKGEIAKIDSNSSDKKKSWKRIVQSIIAGTAVAASIMLSFILGNKHIFDAPVEYNEIQIEPCSKSCIVLSDGTRVHLKASSSLRYPSRFSKDKREVWLNGEAYFEVTHNEEQPFIVHSNYVETTVLGTTFNVTSYSNDETTTVTLTCGLVDVQMLSANGSPLEKVRLTPNARICYNVADQSYTLSRLNEYEKGRDWTNSTYRFRNEKLSNIVKRLENYYGKSIIIKDEELAEIKCTGAFELSNPLENAIMILTTHNSITVSCENGSIVLHR